MRILLHDAMQDMDTTAAPDLAPLKTPGLSDVYTFSEGFIKLAFPYAVTIDCVGIGNYGPAGLGADGHGELRVRKAGETAFVAVRYADDGLYLLGRSVTLAAGETLEVAAPRGSIVGRLAFGKAVNIPTSVTKEPGINSTSKSRRTLSGQVVPGAGGYIYRTLSLDSRYVLGGEAISELEKGRRHIGKGHPFFLDLTRESYKLPFERLYAVERNQKAIELAGSAARYLFGKSWDFRQAF